MKKIVLFLAFIFSGFLMIAQDGQGGVKLFADKQHSYIKYKMYHPMHSWVGISRDVNSVILYDKQNGKILEVAVKTKVSSFDSKNANRDSHMIEVTEALKYPYITFVSTAIEDEGDKVKVTGVLQFHGVKKTISFEAQKKDAANKIRVSGGFVVKVTDFDIELPALLGVPIKDKIEVSFDVYYKK